MSKSISLSESRLEKPERRRSICDREGRMMDSEIREQGRAERKHEKGSILRKQQDMDRPLCLFLHLFDGGDDVFYVGNFGILWVHFDEFVEIFERFIKICLIKVGISQP